MRRLIQKNVYNRVVKYLLWLDKRLECIQYCILYIHKDLPIGYPMWPFSIANVIKFRLQVRNLRLKEIMELDQVHRESKCDCNQGQYKLFGVRNCS